MAVAERRHTEVTLNRRQVDLIQERLVQTGSGRALGVGKNCEEASVTVVDVKDLPRRQRVLVFIPGEIKDEG